MAKRPHGTMLPAALDRESECINRMEFELTLGLEKVIDATLEGFRGGEPFVYGIHQAM